MSNTPLLWYLLLKHKKSEVKNFVNSFLYSTFTQSF
jgi:hypothetical protein